MSARERLMDELAAETFEVNGGSAVYFRTAIKYVDRAWQAREAECEGLRTALQNLVHWLREDTLEIMKDTMKMGITFDQYDCRLLRDQIELAESALSGKREEK